MRAFQPTEASVYVGRYRLGRYAHVERKRFEAFGQVDHALGTFSTRAEALAAIRRAALAEMASP
jgi:hypothetical protein